MRKPKARIKVACITGPDFDKGAIRVTQADAINQGYLSIAEWMEDLLAQNPELTVHFITTPQQVQEEGN